jgi:putative flavoprotein involved in K+ transport
VPRAGVIEYLEDYARHHDIALRLSMRVSRVDRDAAAWRLETDAGPLLARSVVIATGFNNAPRLPDWPGKRSFAGTLLHSSTYKNPEQFRGQHVVVVGTGNSGAEIAVDLAESPPSAWASSCGTSRPPSSIRSRAPCSDSRWVT